MQWGKPVRLFVVLLGALISVLGCDPSASAGPESARQLQDVTPVPDAAIDGGVNLDRGMASDAAQGGDMVMADAAAVDAARPSLNAIELDLTQAQLEGRHSILSDGAILLDPGTRMRVPVDGETLTDTHRWSVAVKARIWRYEDGALTVEAAGQMSRMQLDGDGRGGWTVGRVPYDDWMDLASANLRPPRVDFTGTAGLDALTFEANGGGLILEAIRLIDHRAATPNAEAPAPAPEGEELTLEPCDEVGCDDAAALNLLLASAPEGPLTVRLRGARFEGRTPVTIRRPQARIIGDSGEMKPVWHWSPAAGSGQRSAFELRGGGPDGDESFAVLGDIQSGDRQLIIDGQLSERVAYLRLTAEDFGEVPVVCLEGRDVERFNRHQRQLFEVLALEPLDGTTRVTLDRAINLDIPRSASPRLTAVDLLKDVTIEGLHIEAQCPEALASELRAVVCTNSEVIDDGAVLALYTDGARLRDLSARAFGKFTFEIRDSLRAQVTECAMDHPAAYGGGGQGYGVHLIGASRSVVDGFVVSVARHGVVVDFGSSDSQILNGTFERMNQALLDVHGEASRDTLIRGNTLREGTVGVIIGGGGRAVHCNDQPRHHVIDNRITDCSVAGVSISDYTPTITVRSNEMAENSTQVLTTFGAHDVDIQRNTLRAASITPITVALDDSGDVRVRRNLFEDTCDPANAFLVLGGAEAPVFEDNVFCLPE